MGFSVAALVSTGVFFGFLSLFSNSPPIQRDAYDPDYDLSFRDLADSYFSFDSMDLSRSSTTDRNLSYPSGYTTPVVNYLHNLPRGGRSNEFKSGQKEYWFGVAFLAAIVLVVTLVIAIPCGIAYCVFRSKNFYTFAEPRPYPPSYVRTFSVVFGVFLFVTLSIAITAMVANSVVDNEFIPIVDFPKDLLDNLSEQMVTLQVQAQYANITVPNQVITIQKVVNATQSKVEDALPTWTTKTLNQLDNMRAFAFFTSFAIVMVLCVCGFALLVLGRGTWLSILAAVLFVSIFLLGLIFFPTLILDEAVADFCVDSNDIILNQIKNSTVNGYNYCVFYLMCPPGYTIGQPVFLDLMINATIKLIAKLEDELEGIDTDYESDGLLIEEYEQRIQQAENLLSLEQNLTSCDQTSSEYSATQEDVCRSSLRWNWILTVLIFVLIILETILVCFGMASQCILNENNPKGGSYYVELADEET